MKRRELFVVAACLVLAPALAQAPRRVGVLVPPGSLMSPKKAMGMEFMDAMAKLGFRNDQDVIYAFMEWQKPADVPPLVREMLRHKVEVIVASAPPSIVGARSVTDTVPIVIAFSADPVATGLVQSLNRPGGNLTGLAWDHGFETYVKQLELFQEIFPKLRRVALLWDASDTAHPFYERHFAAAAKERKVELISVGARSPADFAPGFAQMEKRKVEALIILPSAQLTLPHRREIMSLARRSRIPTLAGVTHWDWPGALLVSAPSQLHVPRRAAWYVAQILKGAKPGDLPIEQPSKYELVVDLSVARELGVKIPPAVLARADKVVE